MNKIVTVGLMGLLLCSSSPAQPTPPPIHFEQPVYTPMDFTQFRLIERYSGGFTLVAGPIDFHTPVYYEAQTERLEPEAERLVRVRCRGTERLVRLYKVKGTPKLYRSRPIFFEPAAAPLDANLNVSSQGGSSC
jgi:hypothetical protein